MSTDDPQTTHSIRCTAAALPGLTILHGSRNVAVSAVSWLGHANADVGSFRSGYASASTPGIHGPIAPSVHDDAAQWIDERHDASPSHDVLRSPSPSLDEQLFTRSVILGRIINGVSNAHISCNEPP